VPFSELKGQEQPLFVLKRLLAAKRLPATMAFTGPEGSGRFLAARLLGEALLCANATEHGGCGRCGTCARIKSGGHPDFRVVRPPKFWDPPLWPVPKGREESTEILVDQARALASEAEFKPYEGPVKIYVLDPAEALGESAANALLKLLEEPPPSTHLILIAASKRSLLSTIASRAVALPFHPLTPRVAAELLAQQLPEAPPSEREARLRIAEGRLGGALLADPEKRQAGVSEALELLAAPAAQRPSRLRAMPFARDKQREYGDDLLLAARELCRLKAGRPDSLIFPELRSRYAAALATTPEPEAVAALLTGLASYKTLYLNLRLQLEGRLDSPFPLEDPWMGLE
jgi:DNA polymerase-3 subunit delta'